MKLFLSVIQKQRLWIPLAGALLWAGIASPPPQPAPSFSRGQETLTDLAPVPGNPKMILAASENGVVLKTDQGQYDLLRLAGEKAPILKITAHPKMPDRILLLTENSLWGGDLKHKRTVPLFGNLNPSQNRFYSLAVHPENPDRFYLGTEEGLYQSADGGKSWLRPFRWPENQKIVFAATLPSNPSFLLIASGRELFFSRNGGLSFESGFSLPVREEVVFDPSEEEDPAPAVRFTSFAFSGMDPDHFWVGTSEGVFESRDSGVRWRPLPTQGLADHSVLDLVYSDLSGALIAATPRGVFEFHASKRRWEPLDLGLFRPPSALALGVGSEKKEILFVASGSEILESILDPVEISFEGNSSLPSPERLELFQRLMALEPTVREIHRRAIRYSQLGNGRFQRWQWASRLGSFLPRVGFGKDFSIGSNIDLDRGGTNDPDQYIAGPEDRDRGWDFDLTWNLSDFFFSTAQTSIDSRAKLWVELREEILSQANRLYFERRRAQTEAVFNQSSLAALEYLELLLRIDELTAELDALTDGFLSAQVRKIYRQFPEMNRLWGGDRHL